MKMLRYWPVLLLLGCGVAQPVPQAARLSKDELKVFMSDGSTCTAPIGAGQMPDCGTGLSYRVDLVENPNVLRQLMERALGALGMADALAPLGEVTLTDAAGREYHFVSPPPPPESERKPDSGRVDDSD